jgi:hypothetical protein
MNEEQAAETYEVLSRVFELLGSFEGLIWYCPDCTAKEQADTQTKILEAMSRRDYRYMN